MNPEKREVPDIFTSMKVHAPEIFNMIVIFYVIKPFFLEINFPAL